MAWNLHGQQYNTMAIRAALKILGNRGGGEKIAPSRLNPERVLFRQTRGIYAHRGYGGFDVFGDFGARVIIG
jgi:hypothetical protein